jgi:hypothetical protein
MSLLTGDIAGPRILIARLFLRDTSLSKTFIFHPGITTGGTGSQTWPRDNDFDSFKIHKEPKTAKV